MLILAEFLNHRSPHLYITSFSCLETFIKKMSKTGHSIISESQDMGTSTRGFLWPLELLPLDFDLGGIHHALFYTSSRLKSLKLAPYQWWFTAIHFYGSHGSKYWALALFHENNVWNILLSKKNLQYIGGILLVKFTWQTCKRIMSALKMKPLFISSETDICLVWV